VIPVILWGACGRMGARAFDAISASPDLLVAGAVERDGHPALGEDLGTYHRSDPIGILIQTHPGSCREPGVVLDFSLPGGVTAAAFWAAEHDWNIVSGTTGHNTADKAALAQAGSLTAVLTAPNFSIGILLLLNLVEKASKVLPDNFDVSICETHHSAKRDRPSGTAKAFQDAITGSSPRSRNIDVASLRIGKIVGEHVVRFVSPCENIEFIHHAQTRDVFVEGALQAVRWIRGKPAGMYSMKDVLGLS
jgi:4-hydroxy-tetrahydrodipicolinate reductase